MNNVALIGRLTREPKISMAGETPVANFTIAIDRFSKGEKKTDFIPVVVFGRQAENCEKYIHKGSKVGVEGRIQTGSYEKDGQTVYTTDVIAHRVEFLDSKSDAPQEQPSGFMATDDEMPF